MAIPPFKQKFCHEYGISVLVNAFLRSTVLKSVFAPYRIQFCLLLCLFVNIQIFSSKIQGGSPLVLDHKPQEACFVSYTCYLVHFMSEKVYPLRFLEKYLLSLTRKAFLLLFFPLILKCKS